MDGTASRFAAVAACDRLEPGRVPLGLAPVALLVADAAQQRLVGVEFFAGSSHQVSRWTAMNARTTRAGDQRSVSAAGVNESK